MTPQDVLLQLLDENDYYVRDLLEKCPPACLQWQPDPAANSIGVLIWHVARASDVFLTRHVRNLAPQEELWVTGGWAEVAVYDPHGMGTNGWGMLTGYTAAETAAIPAMDAALLRGYYDAVSADVRRYLESTPLETLLALAPGYGGRQPHWFWVRHPLLDACRHVGEMLALKGMWERRQGGDA